jgi:hypothetical protein
VDGSQVVGEAGREPEAVDGQAAVLAGETAARLLVDAGPGTGKTFVACHRVARLIADGVAPSRIWMISFTRTAIAEIRARIAGALANPDDALSVRIATLDSHAWTLQSGFDSAAKLTGSHDDNIEATLKRVRSDELLQEELERLRHLVIDEAQDILGVRADLVMAIISALDERCGVTAFADEAQSIYGFSEDETSGGGGGETLAARLRTEGFDSVRLSHIHRTECPRLRAIFSDLRTTILDWTEAVADLDATVRSEIVRLAHADAGAQSKLQLDTLPPDALVLMRRRIDVLSASQLLGATPHRLRMSGLPASLAPWLAQLLWDYTQPRLSQSTFEELWQARASGGYPEAAWMQMLEIAGVPGGFIDLRRLRTVLGRSAPPAMFCAADFGVQGPILGTIHASKGREANDVVLYLPRDAGEGADAAEEIRVLFVGATRARQRLSVGQGTGRGGSACEGRAWRYASTKGRVQIEIGRAHDLHADGLVGRSAFPAATDAQAAQAFIAANPFMAGLKAQAVRDLTWRFELVTSESERVAVLSAGFRDSIRQIGEQAGRRAPTFFPYLRSVGLRSMVVRPDDPMLDVLHEPWRSSGFVLAPLLTAFSSAAWGRAS